MHATTATLFTGRDILAAENHLRQGTEAEALRIVAQMPAEGFLLHRHVIKVRISRNPGLPGRRPSRPALLVPGHRPGPDPGRVPR